MVTVDHCVKLSLASGSFHTRLQRPYSRIEVRLEEERHADTEIGSLMDDTVVCRLPFTICPALDHVTDIDDECVRNGICSQPGAVFELDLERIWGGV